MDSYKFHHSALARGYVRVGHEVKEPYNGKADDAEMPAIRKDVSFCMERCDALGVPYWAQNAALAWAENWRATKSEYFDAAMARKGITCSGAAG